MIAYRNSTKIYVFFLTIFVGQIIFTAFTPNAEARSRRGDSMTTAQKLATCQNAATKLGPRDFSNPAEFQNYQEMCNGNAIQGIGGSSQGSKPSDPSRGLRRPENAGPSGISSSSNSKSGNHGTFASKTRSTTGSATTGTDTAAAGAAAVLNSDRAVSTSAGANTGITATINSGSVVPGFKGVSAPAQILGGGGTANSLGQMGIASNNAQLENMFNKNKVLSNGFAAKKATFGKLGKKGMKDVDAGGLKIKNDSHNESKDKEQEENTDSLAMAGRQLNNPNPSSNLINALSNANRSGSGSGSENNNENGSNLIIGNSNLPSERGNNTPNNSSDPKRGRDSKFQKAVETVTELNMPTPMDSSLNSMCTSNFQNAIPFNEEQKPYCCTFIYSSLMAELTILTAGSSAISHQGATSLTTGEISSTGFVNYMNEAVRSQIMKAKEISNNHSYTFDPGFMTAGTDMELANNLYNYASLVSGPVKAKEIKDSLLAKWNHATHVSQLHRTYKEDIDHQLESIIRFAEKERADGEARRSSQSYQQTNPTASPGVSKTPFNEIEQTTQALNKLSNICSRDNVATNSPR